MSKINIEASIKKNNEKLEKTITKAIIEDNRIKYIDNKVITILDIKNQKLKRITEEYDLIIDFQNEKIITDYMDYQLDIDIKIIDKQIESNKIKIKYEIKDTKDTFEYKIIWG